jgi:hypothetical protein
MKIASYEHDSGPTAIRIKLDDGILPGGHSDLTALIRAGPRELDLIRRAFNAQAKSADDTRTTTGFMAAG